MIPLDLVLVLVLGSALVLGELVAEAHSYLTIAADVPALLDVRLVMAKRRRRESGRLDDQHSLCGIEI